ncbi:hypothetical protein [Microbacterium esteraromaticum]|uniref:hypothetical protein n=1 Tax=Microbacterium esteraromaticum TaxID=57043 RepID=UPI00195D9F97|nr:hypothetical protein [Microbacterium esteraromaticum]MBM7464576.1 H2-forming N5,N10-methylenetetrahydromethanopterin dehydrogenase-like enzyme [Microbacterium esteraromaticum]
MTTGQTQQAIILIDDDDSIPLERDQDIGDLKKRIEQAAEKSRFVDFRTAEGAEVSVLLTPHSRVRIAVLPFRLEALDTPPVSGFDDLPADLL